MRSSISKFAAVLAAWALGAVLAGAAHEVRAAEGSATWKVYVTNERSGTLSVIEEPSGRVTKTVPLGKRPRGLKFSPDGKLLYVALSGSPISPPGTDESKLPPPDRDADGIGVVDLTKLELVKILRGVTDPEQLAVGRDGRLLYIASEDSGQAVIMDAQSGAKVGALPVGGEPEGVTLSPDGRFVYMTSESDHRIAVIGTATQRLATSFSVGLRPRYIEFSQDGQRAYVSNENDGSISVVDATRHAVIGTWKLQGGPLIRPVGMAASADGKRLYVATGRGKTVAVLDTSNGAQLGSVEVGERPWGIALSPDGKRVYTANGPSNDVTILDATTLKVLARVRVGDSPWGLLAR